MQTFLACIWRYKFFAHLEAFYLISTAVNNTSGGPGDIRASMLTRVRLCELSSGLLGKDNFAVVRLGTRCLTKTKVAFSQKPWRELLESNPGEP